MLRTSQAHQPDREVAMQTCIFPDQLFRNAFMAFSSSYLLGQLDETSVSVTVSIPDTAPPVLAELERAELLDEPLDLALDNSDTCGVQTVDLSLS
jgi:hypothetical protein